MNATLGRFDRYEIDGRETLHVMWVIGPEGAVSTWFADTIPLIGHSVCDGATLHSNIEVDGLVHSHACEFLEAPCWCARQPMNDLDVVIKEYDADNETFVWGWLAEHYITLRRLQSDEITPPTMS